MSKQEVLKLIKENYQPEWEVSPQKEEVLEDLEKLYSLEPISAEYFIFKSKVLEYMSMNGLEQFACGKYDQGLITKIILEKIILDAIEREQK